MSDPNQNQQLRTDGTLASPTPLGDDSPLRSHFIPLRTATLILPKTGQRVKRAVTLRDPRIGLPPVGNRVADLRADSQQEVGPESPLLVTHRKPRTGAQGKRRRWATWRWRPEQSLKYHVGAIARRVWTYATSRTGQGILKCSIAYLLGSMATFVPFLSDFLGEQDGKHMVATCTVYFHPARTQGSMFEAVFMATLAFVYAAFISFTSMALEVTFDKKLDLLALGHAVVLIVFCGGGLGFVGWVKQRLGSPLANVACSLTSLAIITVLTKEEAIREAEFSADKVAQVMKMVMMGILATTIVNFTILPVSARKDFKKNLIDVTDSFSDLLAMITRGFLTGSEEELEQRGFQEASTRLKSQYGTLSKNLKEGKWEHYVFGTEKQYKLEVRLFNCMRRLQRNLGGLRSAAMTQFTLLAQSRAAGGATPAHSIFTPSTAGFRPNLARIDSWMSFQENFAVLDGVSTQVSTDDEVVLGSEDRDGLPTARSPGEIFERFIMHLGPSMKSLAFTLKQILDELPYRDEPKFTIAINPQFRSSLIDAIDLYSDARKNALKLIYKGKALSMTRPEGLEADFEEVAASCGYFSFSLQDFAEEMKSYLEILEELKEEQEKPFSQQISWSWLKFWERIFPSETISKEAEDEEQNALIGHRGEDQLHGEQPSPTYGMSDDLLSFPKMDQTKTWRRKIYNALRILRRDDIKFAVKVGAGAALYALPSFLEETQPIYEHWRGEWGLLSYMLVCSMTIGSSNTTGFARAWGTGLGALCAVLAWLISQGNVFLMSFFGWIMAIGGFYVIVGQDKGPLGRFILLSYNLTALYAYSLSVKDDEWWDEDEEIGHSPMIWDIAGHRVVAVLSGCLWGLVVTRLIWPISARKKFKDGLSLLLLRMGLIWKRDPLTTLLLGESQNSYMDIREELQLQHFLSRLEALKTSAAHEWELRGKFPATDYAKVLKSVGEMLDAFHAMNVVIMKDSRVSATEVDLMRYTANERTQLCARISHLFQVMASSIKLEFPLNDALPNTDHARDRLLAKVFKYRKSHKASQNIDDGDFALIYAYALVTGQLSREINDVEQVIEKLFGVLDEDLLKLN